MNRLPSAREYADLPFDQQRAVVDRLRCLLAAYAQTETVAS